MVYKRQIDRMPIPPADAKEHNVTCHYCIVGCGYKAWTWPMNKQGTLKNNKFGADLRQQQGAMSPNWYTPSMYNVVKQDGKDVNVVVVPDHECVVNSGLHSVRGARMAENRTSDVTGTQQQRLKEPMVWRWGVWQPTGWDDALDLVAQVTSRVIQKDNQDDLIVSMFDHGGSAGGCRRWSRGHHSSPRNTSPDRCSETGDFQRHPPPPPFSTSPNGGGFPRLPLSHIISALRAIIAAYDVP